MLLGIKKLCFRSFLVTMTAAVTLGSAFHANAAEVTDLTIGNGETVVTDQTVASGGNSITIAQGGTLSFEDENASRETAAIQIQSEGYTVEISGAVNSTVSRAGVVRGAGTNVIINDTASFNVEGYITRGVSSVVNYANISGVREGFHATDSIVNYGNITVNHDEAARVTADGRSTIDNYGTMFGDDRGIDVDADHGLTFINNYAGAQITGDGSDAILINNYVNGIVTNYGSIRGHDEGIQIEDGSLTLINYEGAEIWGRDNGVDAGKDLNVYNYGVMESERDSAINSDGSGSVINMGRITSGTDTERNTDSDGIDYDYSLFLDNYGTVEALNVRQGEAISMGFGTIINHEGATIYSAKEGIRVVGLDGTGNDVFDQEGTKSEPPARPWAALPLKITVPLKLPTVPPSISAATITAMITAQASELTAGGSSVVVARPSSLPDLRIPFRSERRQRKLSGISTAETAMIHSKSTLTEIVVKFRT